MGDGEMGQTGTHHFGLLLQFLKSIIPYNPPENHIWKAETLQQLTGRESNLKMNLKMSHNTRVYGCVCVFFCSLGCHC